MFIKLHLELSRYSAHSAHSDIKLTLQEMQIPLLSFIDAQVENPPELWCIYIFRAQGDMSNPWTERCNENKRYEDENGRISSKISKRARKCPFRLQNAQRFIKVFLRHLTWHDDLFGRIPMANHLAP